MEDSAFGSRLSAFQNWHALGPYNKTTGQLLLTRSVLEQLCRPVSIPAPGVPIDVAAARLGVSRQTIWRWFTKAEKQEIKKAETEERRQTEHIAARRDVSSRVTSIDAIRSPSREEMFSGRSQIAKLRDPTFDSFDSSLRSTSRGKQTRRRGNEHVMDAPFWVGRVRTTASNGLVKDLYPNEADRKRDEVRYWTSSPLDPGGLVAMGEWGTLRVRLLDKFKVQPRGVINAASRDVSSRVMYDKHAANDTQIVTRVWRDDAGRHGRWQWLCDGAKRSSDQAIERSRGEKGHAKTTPFLDGSMARSLDPCRRPCLEHCDKLYWPLPVWTIPAMFDAEAAALCNRPLTSGFLCRNCAGLVYESSEANWGRGSNDDQRTARSEAIAWRRFVQRLSAGVVAAHASGRTR